MLLASRCFLIHAFSPSPLEGLEFGRSRDFLSHTLCGAVFCLCRSSKIPTSTALMVNLACCEVIVIWAGWRTEDKRYTSFSKTRIGLRNLFFLLSLDWSYLTLSWCFLCSDHHAHAREHDLATTPRGDVRPPLLTDRLQTKDYGGSQAH